MKTVGPRGVWVRVPLSPQIIKIMKKETNRSIEEKLSFLTNFCDRMGVPVTINRNPSPEEIKRIKGEIKRSEQIVKQIQKDYEKEI